MNSFIKSRPFKLFALIIAALAAGSIIAAAAHSGKSPLSSVINVVTYPLQKVSTSLSNAIDGYCSYFRSSDTLQKENAALKQQIADYQEELSDYENTKRTLEVYEEFLGVKEENPDFNFICASVLTRETSDIYGSFTLDKGSAKDVSVNDPVIFGKNLVGIVTDVTAVSCTVKTIANPEVNAAVYETRSNETGYVTGFDDGIKKSCCKIPGLSKNSSIATGGIVMTTGIGGVFPKDLIVGTVSEINKSKTDISDYAEVESAVDFSKLTDVFIITSFDSQVQ